MGVAAYTHITINPYTKKAKAGVCFEFNPAWAKNQN